MAVTLEQVLGVIDQEEPDYQAGAQLGADALPFLLELAQGDDPRRASKATCLASHIDATDSAQVVAVAAQSSHPTVRVAAASSLRNLREISPSLATKLLDDDHAGVRKWTLKSLMVHRPEGVRNKVQGIAREDPDLTLRDLASQVVQQLP